MVIKNPDKYGKYFKPQASASAINKSALSLIKWKYSALSLSNSATRAGSLQICTIAFMAALLELDHVARLEYWLMATNSSAISSLGVTPIIAPILWPYIVKPLLKV